MIRFGVVGLGGFATTWARSLEVLEARGVARLAAVTEIDRELLAARRSALEARGVQVYESLEAMLEQGHEGMDIIGLPVGIASHAPLAVQAMQAGYNVLVEKPAAATVQDVDWMMETERRTGQWCAVDYQFLYSPVAQWVLDKLTSGALGAIREVRTRIAWPRASDYYARNAWAGKIRLANRASGLPVWVLDGPATNAVAHYLMQSLYWAALRRMDENVITDVRAELYRAKPIESYDTCYVEARLSNGVRIVHISSHAVSERLEPEAVILCEKGQIRWFAPEERIVVCYTDGSVSGGEETYVADDDLEVHTRALGRVANVVAGREARPACGLREARAQVLAIDLAFESSGGVFQIPESYIYEAGTPDRSLIAVRGLEDALQRAYDGGITLAEVGIPWAQSTPWVSARDYHAFPQGYTFI